MVDSRREYPDREARYDINPCIVRLCFCIVLAGSLILPFRNDNVYMLMAYEKTPFHYRHFLKMDNLTVLLKCGEGLRQDIFWQGIWPLEDSYPDNCHNLSQRHPEPLLQKMR